MEISWYLIDNDGALNEATFLIIHGLDSFSINIVHVGVSILEVSTVVHQIVQLNVMSIFVNPVLVKSTLDVYHVYTCHIDDVET